MKGLDPNKMYRIVDYVNDRVVATNLMGDNAVFNTRFSDYLLVKAVEISEPDPEPVDPDYGFTSVDDRDEALIYTGTWHDDNNASLQLKGTAHVIPTVRMLRLYSPLLELPFAGMARGIPILARQKFIWTMN